jgi:hypothetical protein
MAERKTHEQQPEDRQRAQRGEKHGAEGGLNGGEATSGQSAQVRPGGSAPGGQTPGQAQAEHGSQGLAGAQGSGGGAERGMTQDPDQRRRTSGSGGT